jgi:hypothetical protein
MTVDTVRIGQLRAQGRSVLEIAGELGYSADLFTRLLPIADGLPLHASRLARELRWAFP